MIKHTPDTHMTGNKVINAYKNGTHLCLIHTVDDDEDDVQFIISTHTHTHTSKHTHIVGGSYEP